MSLIVARQDNGKIGIVSETKLTYPNHEIKAQKTAPGEGTIKTIILHDNACVSFAGEVEFAAAAFQAIGVYQSNDQVIDILKQFHIASGYQTEFMFCTGDPVMIYKFKNGELGNVHSCFIGDQRAFNVFQGYMMGELPPKQKNKLNKKLSQEPLNPRSGPFGIIEGFNMSITTPIGSKKLEQMRSAMDYVIEDGGIDSVGGFQVFVTYEGRFKYKHYLKNYRGEIPLLSSHVVFGHGTAAEGAYSVHFFEGAADGQALALHIRQAELGILYTKESGALLVPTLYKLDEVDFIDRVLNPKQIPVQFLTQDWTSKFMQVGERLFNAKDYPAAIQNFDKATQHGNASQKARCYMLMGFANWNLGDRTTAQLYFNAAIQQHAPIKSEIDTAFRNARKQ